MYWSVATVPRNLCPGARGAVGYAGIATSLNALNTLRRWGTVGWREGEKHEFCDVAARSGTWEDCTIFMCFWP